MTEPMDPAEIKKRLESYEKWKKGEVFLKPLGFSCSDLSGRDLTHLDLRGVSFGYSKLVGTDFQNSNLAGAFFAGADLTEAILSDTCLNDASLIGAKLDGTQLPAPTTLLLAHWGKLNPKTTTLLMRLDASAHPDPAAFDRWADGGKCPYTKVGFQRVANFTEDPSLWRPGPVPTIWECLTMVLDEKCPGWRC